MTILHSSKEQKQKPECPPSVVLNLLTQSLKSDTGTGLLFGNRFVVFTVSFLHKVWLELILLSRLREEREQRKNAPGSESDRTALPSETAPGCRVKVFWF